MLPPCPDAAYEFRRREGQLSLDTLGIVRTYDDLQAALRQRADALEMSRTTIDDIAGLPHGYAAKALMPQPTEDARAKARSEGRRLSGRSLGPLTLGPVLETLGLALVVVEDPEAMKRLERGYPQRNPSQVRRRGASVAERHVLSETALIAQAAR
jgi:hypothetical protein